MSERVQSCRGLNCNGRTLPGNTASKTKGMIAMTLANLPPPDRSDEAPMAGQGEPDNLATDVLDAFEDMQQLLDDIRETLK